MSELNDQHAPTTRAQHSQGQGGLWTVTTGAQHSQGQGGLWTVITRHADDWQRRVYGQLQQGSRGPLMTGKDEFMDSKNKAVACCCMLS